MEETINWIDPTVSQPGSTGGDIMSAPVLALDTAQAVVSAYL